MFILDFSEINLEMFPPLVTKYLISNIVLVTHTHEVQNKSLQK